MVMNNPEINKKINKNKKLFETYELFSYGFKYNNKLFYYAKFSRLGKDTGKLVVCDQSSADTTEIQTACKNIYNFNRVINVAREQLYPDMKKPVDVLENLISMISELKHLDIKITNKIQSDIEIISKVLKEVILFPNQLNDILEEMKTIEKNGLTNGYITIENVDRMMELNILYNQIMYDQGRKQLSIISNVNNLKVYLKNLSELTKTEQQNIDKLVQYLDLYTEDKTISDLKRSQKSFEMDSNGNHVMFKEDAEGLDELERSIRAEVNQLLETVVRHELRNSN